MVDNLSAFFVIFNHSVKRKILNFIRNFKAKMLGISAETTMDTEFQFDSQLDSNKITNYVLAMLFTGV